MAGAAQVQPGFRRPSELTSSGASDRVLQRLSRRDYAPLAASLKRCPDTKPSREDLVLVRPRGLAIDPSP